MGANPHSNWLDFSLYDFSVFWVIFMIERSMRVRIREVAIAVRVFIFY